MLAEDYYKIKYVVRCTIYFNEDMRQVKLQSRNIHTLQLQ
jgi:hypothetical protein